MGESNHSKGEYVRRAFCGFPTPSMAAARGLELHRFTAPRKQQGGLRSDKPLDAAQPRKWILRDEHSAHRQARRVATLTQIPALSSPSFGYHPLPDDLHAVLGKAAFSRALVLDGSLDELFAHVPNCRSLWESAVLLPVGLYWFDGVNEPLIVQVGAGNETGPATSIGVAELSDDHPLAHAWRWAESLWEEATSVPSPQFDVQDAALTVPGGVDVVIRGRKYSRGQWSYTVLGEGRTQRILESKLAPLPEISDPEVWVVGEIASADRFSATLTRAKLRGSFANTLYSFRATRTTFRPYQFKPVLKLLQTGKARLLIADEVGLGKTIEAGLIWTELEARHEADRVLIVCPSSLMGKWKEEMQERFGFELAELDTQGLETFLERFREGRLPRRQNYICSLERLRTWSGLAELAATPPEFGLVIVDEAHSMRNSDTKSYELGTHLADWAESLVFLTATPINLRQEDLLHLLELLAPEDYGDMADLELRLEPNTVLNQISAELSTPQIRITHLRDLLSELGTSPYGHALTRRADFQLLREILYREALTPADIVGARRCIAELNTLSVEITRTKKSEVDERKALREPRAAEVIWTDAEQKFYEEYLQWCDNRARAANMPMYFAMQMPLRLASACLPMARQAVLDPAGIRDADGDASDVPAGVPPHRGLIEAARTLDDGVDTKFDALLPILRDLAASNRRALLFTFSKPTLGYLKSRLERHFRVAVMHGGVARDKRRAIMADFRRGQYDFVLANRVASEGLDFEFCSAVVNYDLPWNPMEIEQRIGRIDRIGQPEEKILVVNFYNDATIDERIIRRVLDRIGIFEASIGALEPIIHAQMKTLQTAFDFTLTAEQREHKIHQVVTAIENQRAGLREVSDASTALLVSNDVDIAGLEEDLVRTGRYIGQRELALLLNDWARTDNADGVRATRDSRSIELRGNSTMAERVEGLARSGRRTRTEVHHLATSLRGEIPIPLLLDQELARTTGGNLLTSTNPLVMAAVDVPGHRQARFATLRLSETDDLAAGQRFVVLLAQAISTSRGGDEIWGAAVDTNGRNAGDSITDALLSAVAQGELRDGTNVISPELMARLARRATDLLDVRHQLEQARRDAEASALAEGRRVVISEQHQRRVRTIGKRIQTARERNRGAGAIRLFESQRERANERYRTLLSELDAQLNPEIRLEFLAVCTVEVTGES